MTSLSCLETTAPSEHPALPAKSVLYLKQSNHKWPWPELLAKEISGLSLSPNCIREESLSLAWFPHEVFLRKGTGTRSLSCS